MALSTRIKCALVGLGLIAAVVALRPMCSKKQATYYEAWADPTLRTEYVSTIRECTDLIQFAYDSKRKNCTDTFANLPRSTYRIEFDQNQNYRIVQSPAPMTLEERSKIQIPDLVAMATPATVDNFAKNKPITIYIFPPAFERNKTQFQAALKHEKQHAFDNQDEFMLGDEYVDNDVAIMLTLLMVQDDLIETRGYAEEIVNLEQLDHQTPISSNLIGWYRFHLNNVERRIPQLPDTIGKKRIRGPVTQFVNEQKQHQLLGKYLK